VFGTSTWWGLFYRLCDNSATDTTSIVGWGGILYTRNPGIHCWRKFCCGRGRRTSGALTSKGFTIGELSRDRGTDCISDNFNGRSLFQTINWWLCWDDGKFLEWVTLKWIANKTTKSKKSSTNNNSSGWAWWALRCDWVLVETRWIQLTKLQSVESQN